jgi:ribosomal protein L35AE/L33A
LSVFDDQFAVSAVPGLQGYFGESITYKPRAGGSRSITGMVTRADDERLMARMESNVSSQFRIVVQNSTTLGIATSEVNLRGDLVSLPRRNGDTATDHRIVKILSVNGATVEYELA